MRVPSTHVRVQELEALRGRVAGSSEEGEQIVVDVVPYVRAMRVCMSRVAAYSTCVRTAMRHVTLPSERVSVRASMRHMRTATRHVVECICVFPLLAPIRHICAPLCVTWSSAYVYFPCGRPFVIYAHLFASCGRVHI